MVARGLRRLLEDRRFLFALTFAAIVPGFLWRPVDFDLWWHLRTGELIVATRAVPHVDSFSFTAAGRPWTSHSWLSEVILHGINRLGGDEALSVARALLLAAALMIAWGTARRRGVPAALVAVLVLTACVQFRTRSLMRPYLFSFVMFAAFEAVLRHCADGPVAAPPPEDRPFAEGEFLGGRGGHLMFLPLLTVLWANLHAAVTSGFLMLAAFGAGEMVSVWTRRRRPYAWALATGPEGARFRAMAAAGVFSLAAAVLTPNGAGTLLYPLRLMRDVKLLRIIDEWLPTPLTAAYGVFWFLLVFAGVVLARSAWLAHRAGRLRAEAGEFVTDLLLYAGFGLMAIQARCHVAWILLVTPSVLGRHLTTRMRYAAGSAVQRPPYYAAAIVLAAAVALWPLVSAPRRDEAPRDSFVPFGTSAFIAENKLFLRPYNSYEWGGYLIYRFWPRIHVFIDGRCDLYGDALIRQAGIIEEGLKGWQGLLERWRIEMLVLRYRKRMSAHLFASDEWPVVYWDDFGLVALRRDVWQTRFAGLPNLSLTNPITYHDRLDRMPIRAALSELDIVLGRDPNCWTARAMRARLLVREARAQPGQRALLLREAFAEARQAVNLARHRAEPWEAAADVARALGDASLEAEATRLAEKARRRDL